VTDNLHGHKIVPLSSCRFSVSSALLTFSAANVFCTNIANYNNEVVSALDLRASDLLLRPHLSSEVLDVHDIVPEPLKTVGAILRPAFRAIQRDIIRGSTCHRRARG
jgi:hypothetical protein